MASPPFSLNIGVPGNSDIASQFPTLDRSDKDVIQSWLLVQMNNQGHNLDNLLDKIGSANGLVSAPTPSANTLAIYYDTDASLKQYSGDLAQVEYVGVPPGTIIDYAGATAPAGYLLCYGQAISRTTYSRLFAALGNVWGNGDGSTTFNVPDLRGISTFGQDNMGGTTAGRISIGGGNFDGTILGAGQVQQEVALDQANLPNVSLITTIPSGQGSHSHGLAQKLVNTGTIAPTFFLATGGGAGSGTTDTDTLPDMSGTTALGGSGTAFGIIPNAAIVNKCIKF